MSREETTNLKKKKTGSKRLVTNTEEKKEIV